MRGAEKRGFCVLATKTAGTAPAVNSLNLLVEQRGVNP
jgi:hypothetical protein